MKKYIGIIASVIYALLFRILVEFHVMEMNSWSYLIVVPILMGYLPFVLDRNTFIQSKAKSILFPLVSVILFLVIAFITQLEELSCFVILLPPYVLFSMLVSWGLRSLLKEHSGDSNKGLTKNSLIFIALPLVLGQFEQGLEKRTEVFELSEKISIESSDQRVWSNLFSVPDLSKDVEPSVYNYLGFPNPVRSNYDVKTNTRLGYFSNGMVLHEKVVEQKDCKKLSFAIDVEKSMLDKSQTFQHVLRNKNLIFQSITYRLNRIAANRTELTLSCTYQLSTNIPIYGTFWSKKIIRDFETKLLKALKRNLEKQEKNDFY
ncbi:MAG: hypothetical protein ACKOXP_05195 [Flavobacteriales bacterium]